LSSDILPSVPVHPTEELLEEYSFGRVREPALTPLEEHLFDCTMCQTALLAIDEYTALMQAGITAFERERQTAWAPSRWLALPRIPGFKMVVGAASLLMLLSATIAWRLQAPSPVAPPQVVKLIALRGGGGGGAARASAGRPLDLVIDRTDLPWSLAYRLEVVSSSGRLVWSGIAQITDQNIYGRATTPFRPGAYWVRLYSSIDQPGDEKLRREFGLRIE
jgi:hypothetical protein